MKRIRNRKEAMSSKRRAKRSLFGQVDYLGYKHRIYGEKNQPYSSIMM